MSALSPCLPDLNGALRRVNRVCKMRGYAVEVTNEQIDPKGPIFLRLKYRNGSFLNIGITHLVHLNGKNLEGKDWDSLPFEEVARSTDQVAQAIFARITLFFSARRRFSVDESGTIFHFREVGISIHTDKTFSVSGVLVTYNGSPLPLTRLKSEGVIEFKRTPKGEIELFDEMDRRKGKGMIIGVDGVLRRV